MEGGKFGGFDEVQPSSLMLWKQEYGKNVCRNSLFHSDNNSEDLSCYIDCDKSSSLKDTVTWILVNDCGLFYFSAKFDSCFGQAFVATKSAKSSH